MLKRKAYEKLLSWKTAEQGRSALLVEGARRVGKSTLVEEFARTEYRSYLKIDFSIAPQEIKNFFKEYASDPDTLFLVLSTYYGVTLFRRESLIMFDEIQFFPFARGLVKHLVADGRFDYIETGSLVSIKQNVKDILIPSEEEAFELNPFDFDEFCWAMGEEQLDSFIKTSFDDLRPLPEVIHRKAMRLFREYMLVGGMPAVVASYAESRDFLQADKEKRRIIALYRSDIERFATGYEFKVTSVFDEIPGQLAKHEKKFSLSALAGDPRMRTYEEAFFWLADARVTNMCFNTTDPSVGLKLSSDASSLKCYMADTGLLVTHAFSDGSQTSNKIYRDILLENLNINEGMIVENAVAQALRASGHRLFFYSRFDRENASNRMEIDFLITHPCPNAGMKARVSPIEVKSTKTYGTKSLDKFRARFGPRVGTCYVLHPKNLAVVGDVVYLPLYMAMAL